MSLINTAKQRGFTLVEVLVVIGILAILLAISLVAINPNKHFQDARNSQRSSNVSAVLDAIYSYEAANSGNQPSILTHVTTALPLGKAPTQTATGTAFSTPDLTFTVPSGNTVNSGFVLVTGCDQVGDNGTFPVTGGTTTTVVATNAGASGTSATGCVLTTAIDLCSDLTQTYIADLPTDPTTGTVTGGSTPCAAGTTAYGTGYTIAESSGRFTVAAPSAEGGATISVTR